MLPAVSVDPDASNVTGWSMLGITGDHVKPAVGNVWMSTPAWAVAVAPLESVTVRVTVLAPGVAKACVAGLPPVGAPSPKSQEYDAIVVPASGVALPVN